MRQLYKQGLQKIALGKTNSNGINPDNDNGGSDECEGFEGVQGTLNGDLFGVENILQYCVSEMLRLFIYIYSYCLMGITILTCRMEVY